MDRNSLPKKPDLRVTFCLSIRYSNKATLSYRLEQIADLTFIAALVAITVFTTLFAYEVI
jgi:hypothetical protein